MSKSTCQGDYFDLIFITLYTLFLIFIVYIKYEGFTLKSRNVLTQSQPGICKLGFRVFVTCLNISDSVIINRIKDVLDHIPYSAKYNIVV